MPSKWKPWDLKNVHPYLIDRDKFGVYCCYFFSAFIEQIFLKSFSQEIGEDNLCIIDGEKLTISWIEDNFISPGFFSKDESYLVLNSDKIEKNVIDKLLKSKFDLEGRFLLFSSIFKSTSLKELSKIDGVYLEVADPGPWSFSKLFDFMAKEENVFFQLDAQELLINLIPNTPEDISQSLTLIKLNYPDKNLIEKKDIKLIFLNNNIDKFKLVGYWNKKNKISFYKNIISLDVQSKELVDMFYFLISHLVKLVDVSNIDQGKVKLTNYSREIKVASSFWSKEELIEEISLISYFLTLAKNKNNESFLFSRLREEYLKLLNS